MKASYGVSFELPNARELRQIAEIRAALASEINRLKDPSPDVVGDLRLCRFLRARQGNTAEALISCRNFLNWRATSGVEDWRKEVIGKSPEDFTRWVRERRCPLPCCWYAGRNADGCILKMVSAGHLDTCSFLQGRHEGHLLDGDEKTIIQCMEWTLWHLDQLSRKEGKMCYVATFYDFGEGGTLCSTANLSMLRKLFLEDIGAQLRAYYPDHEAVVLLLNTSTCFRLVFRVVLAAMSKRQKEKVQVLGSTDEPSVRQVLHSIFPVETLPVEMGGTNPSVALSSQCEAAVPAPARREQRLEEVRPTLALGAPRRPAPPACHPLAKSVSIEVSGCGTKTLTRQMTLGRGQITMQIAMVVTSR